MLLRQEVTPRALPSLRTEWVPRLSTSADSEGSRGLLSRLRLVR
jgi:hypothetical protein